MKLYNNTKFSLQSGFFFIELGIACCLLIVITTIVSQCQTTLYTFYNAAVDQINLTTTSLQIAEEFIQNKEVVSFHDLVTIENIPVTYSYLPGESIKGTLIFIQSTKNKDSINNDHGIITGIFDNE